MKIFEIFDYNNIYISVTLQFHYEILFFHYN